MERNWFAEEFFNSRDGHRRSLPLDKRDLRIVRLLLKDIAGVVGAACIVTDELFSPRHFKSSIDDGSPIGCPEMGGATAMSGLAL